MNKTAQKIDGISVDDNSKTCNNGFEYKSRSSVGNPCQSVIFFPNRSPRTMTRSEWVAGIYGEVLWRAQGVVLSGAEEAALYRVLKLIGSVRILLCALSAWLMG